MRVVATGLMVAAIACSSPTGPEDRLPTGTWGGEHLAFEVTAEGGRLEYDCAHGDLGEPLIVDQSGRFDVTGTHTPEHGGPVREDEKLVSHPARYVGRVDGNRMTLTVTVTVTNTAETLGTFALTRGVAGQLLKCL
jgi:hypothetical protein